MVDKTMSVELNLEESGWLCHLLMGQIGPYITGRRPVEGDSLISADTLRAILGRQATLYGKLSKANDVLMGKIPQPATAPRRSKSDVPKDGAHAFNSGWSERSCPWPERSVERYDWIACWHTANAAAFRSHVYGRPEDPEGLSPRES